MTRLDPLAAHMTKDEFKRHGREVIDWIAEYLYGGVDQLPVASRVQPGDIRDSLPQAPPEVGEPFDAMLADVNEKILSGITHWQHPNWHAYFPANISGPSILGDLLSSGLGVQGMLWSTSPACTELETLVLDWMAQALGLPACFYSTPGPGCGVLQDTASSSAVVAMIAARERATTGAAKQLTAYTSTQAHSSIAKAMRIAGLGETALRIIETDAVFAMDPKALAEAIARDKAAGCEPFFICATLGTTSSLAIDPLDDIATIANDFGAWLHVDAAFAGAALVCPEHRSMLAGAEHADSIAFNPHKWLFTNFDCSCFWVRDRAAIIDALTIMPEYLRNAATESGAVIDYRDWQIPLGRRFRSLKLWFVMRHYGLEGFRGFIRHHIGLAEHFAERIENHPLLELSTPRSLSLVCFHHVAGNDATRAMLENANATGALYMTHTRLGDRYVARMSIAQSRVEQHHVDSAFELIAREAENLSVA